MTAIADPGGSARANLPLYDGVNKLKLGTFATNVSNGMTMSHAPTSFQVTWEHTLALARQSEAIGLDMVIPIGRWRGFGGTTNFNGQCFETYTWAAGLAQATERIMIFATSHVPVIHPIVAAKQAVTIDHISCGRFGLNIVMGWFTPEMEMFGAAQREHDDRYRVGEEWLEVIRRLWVESEPFDYDGRFFQLAGAEAWPKPVQQPRPVIMNAGSSSAGRDFAARNADISFVPADDPEITGRIARELKQLARDTYNRDILVFSGVYVICRDTEREAREALREILEHGDTEAAQNVMSVLGIQSRSFGEILEKSGADRFVAGFGAPTFMGTPEQVAEQIVRTYDAGVTGLTLAFLDYAPELAYFDDHVMPLLRQAGLRA